MKQKQILTINAATDMVHSIVAGIMEVGATVTLPHNPTADINTDLVNLITARNNHEQAKQIKMTRREEFVAAMDEAKKLIRGTREIYKLSWGNDYSERFTALGFQKNLVVPDDPETLQGMLQAIKAQLTTNPTQELPPMFTATRAQTLFDAMVTAKNAVMSQEAEITSLMGIRDEKFDVLCKRISSVYQELRMQLAPLDPRWLKFGFNMPGADETPDQVTGVKVTLIGPTAAAVKWEGAARASYYRIWMKLHGSTTDYSSVGSPADLDFTIEDLPANSTVDIVVTAVNNGGESPVSDVITIATQS